MKNTKSLITSGNQALLIVLVAALSITFSARSQGPPEAGRPDQPPTTEPALQRTQVGGGGGGFGGGGQMRSGQARYGERLQGIVRRGPGNGGKAIVVRTSEGSPKEQANLEEDLAVMSHILDKTVDETAGRRTRTAMGIDVFFSPSANPMRSLFLEGYGALFMLKVGFPLLPPPSKEAPPKEEQSSDSTWENAKRELYGHPVEGRFNRSPAAEYDDEKVNALRDAILESLKNASNIRNLKNEEVVTVCLLGNAEGGPKVRTMTRNEGGKIIEEREALLAAPGPDGGSPARGTIMTIRVKKSDADAYAKGKLNLDEFRKKAKITTYEGSVGGDGAGAFGALIGSGDVRGQGY